jgi:hypothetical protein
MIDLLMYYGQLDLLSANQKQTSGCVKMMKYMSTLQYM